MRLLAGGRSAANQIEYIRKYGSALPVFFTETPPSADSTTTSTTSNTNIPSDNHSDIPSHSTADTTSIDATTSTGRLIAPNSERDRVSNMRSNEISTPKF